MLPITDEQAKLGQEIVKALRASGSYLAEILGDLPKDFLGQLIGDRVKARRIERATILWEKTLGRLRDWRVEEPEPPSLKFAIPILEAAVDEENTGLQDLWARLLASAMDPARRDEMRKSFVETVKQMDPMDASVLEAIRKNEAIRKSGDSPGMSNAVEAVATSLSCSHDQVIVFLEHLAKLDCVRFLESPHTTGPI